MDPGKLTARKCAGGCRSEPEGRRVLLQRQRYPHAQTMMKMHSQRMTYTPKMHTNISSCKNVMFQDAATEVNLLQRYFIGMKKILKYSFMSTEC